MPAVCAIKCVGDLRPEIEQAIHRNRLALDAVFQGGAIEILHHDVLAVLILADVVNGADIGMIERGRRPCLTPEALQGLRVLSQIVGQELQCYPPAKA
jgi:hypothetical protein